MSLVKCSHCQLEFDEKVMIKEEENTSLHFCCNGCQGVYHILHDDGLSSFYDKLGKHTISQPLAIGSDSSAFDMDSFQQRYVKKTSEGFSKVDLIIEGIHCAACIWLNEKILDETNGIVEAKINFTNNKAKIVWDQDIISLSSIINRIRSIGYNAYPYEKTETDKKSIKNNRDYFLRMSIAIFSSMNIMMIGVAKYAGFFTGMSEEMTKMVHFAEWLFATPVLFYSGWIFFRGAYFGLRNKIINMDFLVITGASLTYIYSLYVLFGGAGNSYFDSVSMIITFVLVGKYLEVLGKKSAIDTMDKIKSYIPLEATIIENEGKKVVSLDAIKIGDIIEVKTGEKASVDGEVISGESSFDESSISGESLPVGKNIGSKIFSGTINLYKVIRYKATKDYANSTLNHIVELLEDSLNSKPKIEEMTNNLSKYFSVTILLLATITFSSWYFMGLSFENSLIITISVIVIACPCALALATPIASLVGISWLGREGILFKESKFIETFAKATTVVFDKTGTLTYGKLKVISHTINLSDEELNLLYSLADSSTHPISKAVKSFLIENYHNLTHIDLLNIKQLPAIGVSAEYKDIKLFGGKADETQLYTSYVFKLNEKELATFFLEDEVRIDAQKTIEYLQKNNIETIMCSGDNDKVVKNLADSLGIKEYYSGITPEGKANLITTLREEGKIVVMVGDGINDSLALSRADVSIAMGNGADISLAVSDIVILNDKLDGVMKSFYISKRTFSFIKQNLSISLVYNLITLPLAIFGYVIPLIAALSMSLSSILVIGNSMRIKEKQINLSMP
ncbi:MAG: cadmium-translocating P-type ATPase [Epsilonproteobacteria bacterium]|nr:cadmium-translocating P-type ATPase [Campylobacterota bacterium]